MTLPGRRIGLSPAVSGPAASETAGATKKGSPAAFLPFLSCRLFLQSW